MSWTDPKKRAPRSGDQYTGLDRFGRIVDSRWINGSAADINRIKYGYDNASNRIWRQNTVAGTGQDEYYTYDGLYQLDELQRGTLNSDKTGITGTPSWEEDFDYDPTGNWNSYVNKISGATNLDQDRTHNTVNETTALNGSSLLTGYDAAGNMTTAPQPEDWSSAYSLAYDAWDRLVNVASGGTAVAAYAYDGQNRRVTKTTSAETRHYYYSSRWQILEERTGSSTSADRQFVWGLQGVDDLVLRDRFGGSGERLYALGDAMSVTAVTDTTGAVQERYGYDAFGNTNVMNASFGSISGSAYDWETRFCGYRWDGETNFYQVRNRYLHSSLGRWLSRDPIKEQGGLNLYAYVLNSPTNLSDPTGLDCTGGPGNPGSGTPDDLTKTLLQFSLPDPGLNSMDPLSPLNPTVAPPVEPPTVPPTGDAPITVPQPPDGKGGGNPPPSPPFVGVSQIGGGVVMSGVNSPLDLTPYPPAPPSPLSAPGTSFDVSISGGDILGGSLTVSISDNGVTITPVVGVGFGFEVSGGVTQTAGDPQGMIVQATAGVGNGYVGGNVTGGDSWNGPYGSATGGGGFGGGASAGFGYVIPVYSFKK